MSLLEEALLLQRAAHDLMYLGMDGSPIYSDDLSRRNSEVYRLTTTLYNSRHLGHHGGGAGKCMSCALEGV